MDDRLNQNQDLWDELAGIHVTSDFYDVASFRKTKMSLHQLERDELGAVQGKSLLHLQCHFGMDTISWATLGADVTGVDFSPESIRQAQQLASEVNVPAQFICSDVYSLPENLDRQFDIVFTSYGVLVWLPDLPRWAEVIAQHLKSGGVFYIAEEHPGAHIFDDKLYPPTVVESYFREEPWAFTDVTSYATGDRLEAEVSHQWHHGLGAVVTALAGAGLHIEFLHEHPFCMFQRHQSMQLRDDGWWHLPEDNTPQLFTLKATKSQR